MQLIDSIDIGEARIELLHGDLTDIPARYAVDLLVVAGGPADYLPTPDSVIGALHRRGVSVTELARQKLSDFRDPFSCWVSRAISHPHPPGEF